MSARQWKPGDVAILRRDHGGGKDGFTERIMVKARDNDHWRDAYGDFTADAAVTIRPLVVIDPEDRKQVVALAHAWEAQTHFETGPERMTPNQYRMRQALRSLVADPKPKVYSHIRADLSPGGVSTSLCGKAWRAGEEDVEVVGQCPNCLDLISEWIS